MKFRLFQLSVREIDRDNAIGMAAEKLLALCDGAAQDPIAELEEGAVIFQPGKKFCRRYPAIFAFPAQISAASVESVILCIEHGLIEQGHILTVILHIISDGGYHL